MLLGVPVNPNGLACPRFVAKNVTSPLLQQPSVTYVLTSPQTRKTERSEVSLVELKQRLDKAEAKIRKIKTMLQHIK